MDVQMENRNRRNPKTPKNQKPPNPNESDIINNEHDNIYLDEESEESQFQQRNYFGNKRGDTENPLFEAGSLYQS
jgi:hypothetical protein